MGDPKQPPYPPYPPQAPQGQGGPQPQAQYAPAPPYGQPPGYPPGPPPQYPGQPGQYAPIGQASVPGSPAVAQAYLAAETRRKAATGMVVSGIIAVVGLIITVTTYS